MARPWHVTDAFGMPRRPRRIAPQMRGPSPGRGFRFEVPQIPHRMMQGLLKNADIMGNRIASNPQSIGVPSWMMNPTFMPGYRKAKERDAQIRAEWAANPSRRRRRGVDPNTGLAYGEDLPTVISAGSPVYNPDLD